MARNYEYRDDRYAPSGRERYRAYAREDAEYTAVDAAKDGMDEAIRGMREISEAQERGQHVPDYKFLGLISMPAVAGPPLRGLATMVQNWVGKHAQHGAQTVLDRYVLPNVSSPRLRSSLLNTTALATGLGVVMVDDGIALYKGFSDYKKGVAAMAEKVAPVLDELKGGHGFLAAQRVGRDDNEVIYLEKTRLAQTLRLNSKKVGVNVAGKATVIIDQTRESAKRVGMALPAFMQEEQKDPNGIYNAVTVASGSLAEIFQENIVREFKKANAKPTPLTLIHELAVQLRGSPDIDGFEVKGTGRQLPLRDYIAFVFRSHHEEMSKLYPEEYTTIRASLNESLLQVSEQIATAIRDGRVDPLMLVRLVGERQIVKNCGRAVASEKDVESVIRHMSGKASDYVKLTKADILKDVSEKDFKDTANALEGDARKLFLATVPENVLVTMGFSKKEAHEAHEAIDPKRTHSYAAALVGLAENDPKELSAMGQDKHTIQRLARARDDVMEAGPEAIARHLTSSINPDGLEQALVNAVVEKRLDGDIAYLGRLQRAGSKLLAEAKRDMQEPAGHAENLARQREMLADRNERF